jgi:Cof subfamily protein (haloacid dehalogenase superfamily)
VSHYRIVVIDVDGTLVGRDRPISARDREAIGRALDAGIVVTLASGRMFPLVETFVRQLGLTAPTICYGGAMIVDPLVVRPLFQRGVPLALSIEVIREARGRGLTARAYVGTDVFVESIDVNAYNYESLTRVNAIAVGDLERFLSDDPSHLAIDAPPDLTRGLVREMRARFAGRLNVTTGHPLLTEFSHPSVHKGSALRWLCKHVGLPPVQSIAIGDDWNDVEMLSAAGLAIAVGNAQPDVLALADVVVPTVGNSGVAHALERFVL